jgi:hypothetical protein
MLMLLPMLMPLVANFPHLSASHLGGSPHKSSTTKSVDGVSKGCLYRYPRQCCSAESYP